MDRESFARADESDPDKSLPRLRRVPEVGAPGHDLDARGPQRLRQPGRAHREGARQGHQRHSERPGDDGEAERAELVFEDGSVELPGVLAPYVNGETRLRAA